MDGLSGKNFVKFSLCGGRERIVSQKVDVSRYGVRSRSEWNNRFNEDLLLWIDLRRDGIKGSTELQDDEMSPVSHLIS